MLRPICSDEGGSSRRATVDNVEMLESALAANCLALKQLLER